MTEWTEVQKTQHESERECWEWADDAGDAEWMRWRRDCSERLAKHQDYLYVVYDSID
jgi:hypothetical protein